jgi:Ala-tRNA(Pro) deacylase
MSGSKMATAALAASGVPFELLPHPPTETALAEAHVLGVTPSRVAKTVILQTPTGYVRAVLPASRRLNLHKVRLALGEESIRLAREDELRSAYPEFELGAIPPFGGLRPDPVVLDVALAQGDAVVLEAGTTSLSVRLAAADLIAVLGEPELADICDEEGR